MFNGSFWCQYLGIFPEPSVAPGGVSLNHGMERGSKIETIWQWWDFRTVVPKLITHTHMAMVTAWYRRIVSQPSSFFGVSENRVQKKNISDYHLPHLPSKLLKLWGSSGRPPFWKPGKTRSQARPLTWSAGQESSLKVLQLDSVDISNSWVYQLVNHSGVSKHVKMDHNYVCQFWCIIIQQYNHMYIYSHWL